MCIICSNFGNQLCRISENPIIDANSNLKHRFEFGLKIEHVKSRIVMNYRVADMGRRGIIGFQNLKFVVAISEIGALGELGPIGGI